MSNDKREYNNTISLKQRDLSAILEKAEQSNYDRFMQLHLQGASVWVGSREPYEGSIDRLHALYYKLHSRKGGIVYLCLGLWRHNPTPNELYNTLLSINASTDAVISSYEIAEFLNLGESEYITLRHPTRAPLRKTERHHLQYN